MAYPNVWHPQSSAPLANSALLAKPDLVMLVIFTNKKYGSMLSTRDNKKFILLSLLRGGKYMKRILISNALCTKNLLLNTLKYYFLKILFFVKFLIV